MIEVLLALSITLAILLNCASIVKLCKVKYIPYNQDIPTGAKSLSSYLMTGTITEVGDDLHFKDVLGQGFTVTYDNNRLVKKPGYEIIIFDIDEAYFTKERDFVFLHVRRQDLNYKYLVGEFYKQKPKEEDPDEDQDDSQS